MFTGLVEEVGALAAVTPTERGARLRLAAPLAASDMAVGDSVCVDGACLTAVAVDPAELEVEAVAETLRRTTLGLRRPGHRVNLERALRVGDRLGGHIVQGHVDGLAEVVQIQRSGRGHLLVLSASAEMIGQMVPSGSVALAGVSLTLLDVARGRFSVALIPTTIRDTTLGSLHISNRINMELDIIGKYVRRYLEGIAGGSGLTIEKLRQAGFA